MAGAAGQGGAQAIKAGAGATPPSLSNSLAGGYGTDPYSQAAKAQQAALGGMTSAMNYTPQQVSAPQATAQGYDAERATAQGYNAERVAGVGPITEQTVSAAQLATTSMDPYMNPYTEQVIKANEADILRGATMGLNQLGAQAQAAKAFGGSRQAIAEAEYGRNVAQQLAQSSAGLRQAGFAQAQAAAQQDLARKMQAQQLNQAANLQAQTTTGQFGMQRQLANQAAANQASLFGAQAQNTVALANQAAANQAAQFGAAAQNQASLANQQAALQAAMANQQAGLTGNQQSIGAAQGLSGLGQTSFGYGTTLDDRMAAAGAQQQALNQALIGQSQGMYGQYQAYPQQSLGFMANILGSAPHGQTQSRQLGLMDYLTAGAKMATMF